MWGGWLCVVCGNIAGDTLLNITMKVCVWGVVRCVGGGW